MNVESVLVKKQNRLRPKKSEVKRLCSDNSLRDKLLGKSKRTSLQISRPY